MQHPKSENILKVIAVFKKVLPMATKEKHLDMWCGEVNSQEHVCGTVHCHGGWYAVGSCDLKNTVDFKDGAKKMARTLGFKDHSRLKLWAMWNSNLWGNENGMEMFIMRCAFSHPQKRPSGAFNLQHIIDHWTEVYERVKALEDKQTRKDATAELIQTPVVEEKLDVVGEKKLKAVSVTCSIS